VFGGLRSGGYRGETNDLAVLEPSGGGGGEMVWTSPETSGLEPQPRGYHSACCSEDGTRLYVSGGICDGDCTDSLAVLDLTTMCWDVPATTGAGPPRRFGHTSVVWRNTLFIIGGGNGGDLLRSGVDLNDVWTLDLSTLKWTEVTRLTADWPSIDLLGRCHSGALVGRKWVIFGGSLGMGNAVTWLDLDTLAWGGPSIKGRAPLKRISAAIATVITPLGLQLVVYGGGREQVPKIVYFHWGFGHFRL